ncbi:hypothetical protein HMPREF0168_0446 [Bifidobacterium dentium ATCC 27679]|uniref:Uncharacterized protein n=1 Tax=Bifidobacterium dentium ATCC 27679 TaxID=871562 RepID=E0Q5N9_9BIFI|nr:hypothetical protein HMPREF0168_0446 [Bifidobacterium dentium ATCC 27679]
MPTRHAHGRASASHRRVASIPGTPIFVSVRLPMRGGILTHDLSRPKIPFFQK